MCYRAMVSRARNDLPSTIVIELRDGVGIRHMLKPDVLPLDLA